MKKIFFVSFCSVVLLSFHASAQGRRSRVVVQEQPQWTWDLGAAAGTYGGYSYSEIDLGLNDHFWNYLNWRNVVWDRFGSASAISALGLDSSLRYEFTDHGDGGVGFRFFAGPGVRVSSSQYSGVFAEGGMIFRIGSFSLGAGVKALKYSSPGNDPVTGVQLPGTDLMYFIILSGGGAL
jgi:hypothetical protein